MLGHKDLRITQHYAKIVYRKISDDMNLLKEKLEAKQKALEDSKKVRIHPNESKKSS